MPSISRRELLYGSGSAALLTLPNTGARAQSAGDWPNKTVRMIVNFAPGGSTDNAMRPFADRLSRALGQQFVIDNKGGASGAIGIEAAVKSAPDGYNFLATVSLSVVIVPHLRKTTYDPLKDLVPVTQFTDGTLLFAVHPSVPANSVQELVAYAKQNPGKLSWGTAGVGSYGHLLCEAFKLQAGVDILHVPYRGGGESLADFLAGVVQIHADPNTMPHVSGGKAKLLAVLDRKPPPGFPQRAAPEGDLSGARLPGLVRAVRPAGHAAADRSQDGRRDEQGRPRAGDAAAPAPSWRSTPNPGTPEELGRAPAQGPRTLWASSSGSSTCGRTSSSAA